MENHESAPPSRPLGGLPWPADQVREYMRARGPTIDTRGHLLTKLFGGAVVLFLRALSWEMADRLGSVIGWVLATLRVRRDVALTNLDIAYGDSKTRAEKLAIYKGSMLNFGRHILNYARAARMDEEFRRTRFEIEGDGEARIHEVMARGKGLLIVGGHLGEWELALGQVGLLGYPVWMIAKRPKNPVVDRFIIDARLAINLGTFEGTGTMEQILAAIRRGEAVTMAVDQNTRERRGVYVDFLGRTACTVRSSSFVQRETGAPILTGMGYRYAPGRYRLIVGEEVEWVDHEDPEQALILNTRRHAEAVEKLIYAYPTTWLWIHRRYKHQPAGTESPYPDDVKRARRRAAREAAGARG